LIKQEIIKQFEKWYESVSDYVLFFTSDWSLLWENQECPMLSAQLNPEQWLEMKKENKPVQGTLHRLVNWKGLSYSAQLDVHSLALDSGHVSTEQEDPDEERIYVLRIAKEPYQKAIWQHQSYRESQESKIALLRNQISNISNSTDSLCDLIFDFGDRYPSTIYYEMLDELNLIEGNC